MATSPRDASTTITRRADPKRVGPLMGWAWREARLAMQFGKRQGAWAVDFRADRVRFYLDGSANQAPSKQPAKQRRDSSRREAGPPREPPSQAGDGAQALSTGKQKKLDRLLEFNRRKRIKLLWRRVLHKVVGQWRHQRLWNVHNAWYAARSAPAEAAGPPAPEPERMDEDGTTIASPAEQGADAASPPPRGSGEGSSSGGSLNPAAKEFVPWQRTVVLVDAQSAQAHELAVATQVCQRRAGKLRKELRAARKAERDATEAAEAAKVAKHNADAVLRAHRLRTATSKPLGISRPPSG